MHIELPSGDKLVPDAEFAERLGIVRRTLSNWDRQGLPFVMVGGRKYRPLNEGLAWIASRIKRGTPAVKSTSKTRKSATNNERAAPAEAARHLVLEDPIAQGSRHVSAADHR
jgi:phage terminase Nu1 subunit (DNA packaging protein)